jgi:predicted esterase
MVVIISAADSAAATVHVIAPTTTHTHTVIWLHGRGSNAKDFASELFESQASDDRFFARIFPGVRWVFPCATKTMAEEETEEMQWFDMQITRYPDQSPEVQKPGLRDSVSQTLALVRRESAVVGVEKVFLAGISQGCATSMLALLAGGVKIGGFVGLCGWLPLREELESTIIESGSTWQQRTTVLRKLLDISSDSNDSTLGLVSAIHTPVLLQHSCNDDVIPIANGEVLARSLKKLGMPVELQCFEQDGENPPHWLNEPEGMDGIVAFFKEYMTLPDEASEVERG